MHDMQHDDMTTKQKGKRKLGVTLGMLQTPPLKESRPEILRKKRRRTGTRMVRPLHLEELDRVVASSTFSFIKNPNGVLFVGEVFLEVDGLVMNCTVRIFEALLEP